MKRYRKLISAVVGLAVLFAGDFFGVDGADGLQAPLVEGIVAFLTLFGVWGLPNEPAEPS